MLLPENGKEGGFAGDLLGCRGAGDQLTWAHLTLRVPAARCSAVMAALQILERKREMGDDPGTAD